ncbi:MAG: Ppx/GppA family phosphatase [Alphaproteobacteria bacterium]|nr:Ppx/GppA family phosphatase [Alphaproteobacteria bacterium]
MSDKPVAIIDIGSNSVRLVVYAGATRIPWIIFNEKVLAGLGQAIASTGALPDEAQHRALAALRRFRTLADEMGVARTLVVATAAVRDASNGPQFLEKARAIGFMPMMLSGEQEGVMAGLGVLSAIPEADGIVADLGGGSLELVDVGDGKVHRSASFPLGVLRIEAMIKKGEPTLAKKVAKAIDSFDIGKRSRKRPLYMVGGSWRALARLDMVINDYPLPITHHYEMAPERPEQLQTAIEALSKADVKSVPSLSLARVPMLPYANRILKTLVAELRPTSLVVSSFGIREGLLYHELDAATRAQDPLLEAAREAGQGLARFGEHGDLLDRWLAPVFDDGPAAARLRLAACLLADIAWQAHPDFRAERGVDMALHGNWVGVDAPGRVMIAQALFCNFGGAGRFSDLDVAALCSPDELERASQWGLAMRLGQRLGGGVASSLEHSHLRLGKGVLRLELENGAGALRGEAVERRLRTLASALGRKPEVVVA